MEYLQEIVLSPDVFRKIDELEESEEIDLDTGTYLSNMKLKKYVFDIDKNRVSFLKKEILNMKDNIQSHIGIKIYKKLFDLFSVVGCYEEKLISSKKLLDNKLLNVLLQTAFVTDDKIIHCEDRSIHEQIRSLGCTNLEVVNVDDFCHPTSKSRIFNYTKDLMFQKGDIIDLPEYLKYYFLNARNIIICDKYIVKKNIGYPLFLSLLDYMTNLEEIEIWSDFENAQKDYDKVLKEYNDVLSKEPPSSGKVKNKRKYLNKAEYVSPEEIGEEIKDKLGCSVKIYRPAPYRHARYIYTDKFYIQPDPGLSFLDKDLKNIYNDNPIKIRSYNDKGIKSFEYTYNSLNNIRRERLLFAL